MLTIQRAEFESDPDLEEEIAELRDGSLSRNEPLRGYVALRSQICGRQHITKIKVHKSISARGRVTLITAAGTTSHHHCRMSVGEKHLVNPKDLANYPKEVPKTIEYSDAPLFKLLDDSAKEFPDRPALVLETKNFDKVGSMTYHELGEASDKFAAFLVDKGIKAGDKVAVFLPNMMEFVVAYYGILKAGATVVSLNFQYPASELTGQLKISETRGIVAADMITPAAAPYETCKKVRDSGETQLEFIVVASVKQYLSGIKGILAPVVGKVSKKAPEDVYMHDIYKKYSPSGRPKADPKPNDTAVIMFTGGTTGTPKGAMLTHRNLGANVEQILAWAVPKIDKGRSPLMGSLPFYHSYGATTAMNTAVASANLLVLMLDPREGEFTQILELLQKYKVQYFHAVPTLYIALLNHPNIRNYDLSAMKASMSGAAPLPVAVLEQYQKKTGANMVEGYGLTETSPVTHSNPLGTPPGSDKPVKKAGSIGLPFPDTDAIIVDTETGTKILGVGEEGEIAVSGPQVMKGYYNRPEETKAVMREFNGKRFFLTGDIGKYDDEGYFFITDRKKDMIDVGGFKAYPREIEEILIAHPKISNAAVIGVPHEKVGETVKVFVVPKPGVDLTKAEVLEYCREKLVKYKQPHSEQYIEFRESLPMTQVGKVLRRALKDEELKTSSH